MENPELTDSVTTGLYFFPADFNEEYDDYDQTEDDYDFNKEDTYDDGIAGSLNDDGWEDGPDDDSEEGDPETGISAFRDELEDSLQETEDYDALDD